MQYPYLLSKFWRQWNFSLIDLRKQRWHATRYVQFLRTLSGNNVHKSRYRTDSARRCDPRNYPLQRRGMQYPEMLHRSHVRERGWSRESRLSEPDRLQLFG